MSKLIHYGKNVSGTNAYCTKAWLSFGCKCCEYQSD